MARKPQAGPASDPELLILSSLAGGPKHGYAMLADIEMFASSKLGPGTLVLSATNALSTINMTANSILDLGVAGRTPEHLQERTAYAAVAQFDRALVFGNECIGLGNGT